MWEWMACHRVRAQATTLEVQRLMRRARHAGTLDGVTAGVVRRVGAHTFCGRPEAGAGQAILTLILLGTEMSGGCLAGSVGPSPAYGCGRPGTLFLFQMSSCCFCKVL